MGIIWWCLDGGVDGVRQTVANRTVGVGHDAGYEIEFRWKEQVVYWEGGRGVIFEGAWGTEPDRHRFLTHSLGIGRFRSGFGGGTTRLLLACALIPRMW